MIQVGDSVRVPLVGCRYCNEEENRSNYDFNSVLIQRNVLQHPD